MSRVTTYDVNRIITGEKVEITIKYPLTDKPEGFRWFIMQPTDWLYDMGLAVGEAAEAEVMALPEMESMRSLPPSKAWLHQQTLSRQRIQKRIDELLALPKRTPEEDLELEVNRSHLERLIDPASYTRADEIAAQNANRARDFWLLPRLIVDDQNALLCDLSTPEGQYRWQAIGRKTRLELRGLLMQVLSLVLLAKN